MSDKSMPVYSALAAEEDIREIIVLYVDEMPERVDKLQNAFDEKNWDELRTAVHQLKGSAGSHGFAELSRAALELENALKSSQAEDQIAETLRNLIELCRRTTSDPEPK